MTFLQANGVVLTIDFDSLFEITLCVARSEMDKEQLAEFFTQAHQSKKR